MSETCWKQQKTKEELHYYSALGANNVVHYSLKVIAISACILHAYTAESR